MWEFLLGFIAAASCFINLQDLGIRRLNPDGENTTQRTYDCIFIGSFIAHFGKDATIKFAGMLWVAVYGYHYIIAQLSPASAILHILNIMVVILISARFCRLMYRLSDNNYSPIFHSDLLTATACLWEVVLAGVVIIHVIIKNRLGA